MTTMLQMSVQQNIFRSDKQFFMQSNHRLVWFIIHQWGSPYHPGSIYFQTLPGLLVSAGRGCM